MYKRSQIEQRSNRDMNVIVIVADSFRQDHGGCYGEARAKTPNLDAFAQKSAVFKNLWHGNLPTPQ